MGSKGKGSLCVCGCPLSVSPGGTPGTHYIPSAGHLGCPRTRICPSPPRAAPVGLERGWALGYRENVGPEALNAGSLKGPQNTRRRGGLKGGLGGGAGSVLHSARHPAVLQRLSFEDPPTWQPRVLAGLTFGSHGAGGPDSRAGPHYVLTPGWPKSGRFRKSRSLLMREIPLV